jgi:flagellin FlaB
VLAANTPGVRLFRLQPLALTFVGRERMNKSKVRMDNRGTVSIEVAIVLIAFIIATATFAFMAVNMGLFVTQRGRESIQQGISESGSPLAIGGNTLIREKNAITSSIDAMMIPLKVSGVKYVPMGQNVTEISLRVENRTAYADIYMGVNNIVDPLNAQFDTLVLGVGNGTRAMLFVGNSNGNDALDFNEKGYMIIHFATTDEPIEREQIYVEIKPERGVPLLVDFVVPPQTTQGWSAAEG